MGGTGVKGVIPILRPDPVPPRLGLNLMVLRNGGAEFFAGSGLEVVGVLGAGGSHGGEWGLGRKWDGVPRGSRWCFGPMCVCPDPMSLRILVFEHEISGRYNTEDSNKGGQNGKGVESSHLL